MPFTQVLHFLLVRYIHSAALGMLTVFATIGWLKLSGADPTFIDWLKLLLRLANPVNWPLYAAAAVWGALLMNAGHWLKGNLPIGLPVISFLLPVWIPMPLTAEVTLYTFTLIAFWVLFVRKLVRMKKKRVRPVNDPVRL